MVTSEELGYWAAPYRLAVMEIDPGKMSARIATARSAIRARIIELKKSADGRQELVSLNDALRVLRLLEKAS